MSRYIAQGTSKDGNGKVICGATISVYLAGGLTPASVYAASAGGTHVHSVTSGAITDSQPGYFCFWVDDGDYLVTQRFKIIITKDGFSPSTYDYMMLYPMSVSGLVYLGRLAADPDPVALGWGVDESGYFWDNISDPANTQRKMWSGSEIVLEA
jgi:hypothetical protein